MPDELTVGRVADLVGVSVKTLHHWDDVGLVRPEQRTPGGYRVYSSDDVARLHQVLVHRELGFSLAEIGRLLDDPDLDGAEQLRRQRSRLVERIGRLEQMVGAVDRLLEASSAGIRLSADEQVALFGTGWDPAWVSGAEERWGETRTWAQYAERAGALSREGWARVAERTAELEDDLAAAYAEEVLPGSGRAGGLAERHRALMSTYFDCGHERHACLGRLLGDDPDYAAHYEERSPGLAAWLRDVIGANAARHGVDPATARWG